MHKALKSHRKAIVRTANRVHLKYSVNVEFRRRIDAQAGSIRLRINHMGQQVRFAIPSLSNTPIHVWNKKNNQILELASNDGYLLQFFKKKKNVSRIIGVEPTKAAADLAKKKNIYTIQDFFNYKYF